MFRHASIIKTLIAISFSILCVHPITARCQSKIDFPNIKTVVFFCDIKMAYAGNLDEAPSYVQQMLGNQQALDMMIEESCSELEDILIDKFQFEVVAFTRNSFNNSNLGQIKEQTGADAFLSCQSNALLREDESSPQTDIFRLIDLMSKKILCKQTVRRTYYIGQKTGEGGTFRHLSDFLKNCSKKLGK